MEERGILFSAPMVRALLEGSKTQTRRALKDIAPGWPEAACPYGQPGHRLWVRETFGRPWHHAQPEYFYRATDSEVETHPDFGRWTPSIHMPRWASRILLEVVSVRVERLQDISEADAIAEGIEKWGTAGRNGQRWNCPPHVQRFGSGDNIEDVGFDGGPVADPREAYRGVWSSINGAGSWDANPWVWVVEFKRVTP